MEAKEALDMIKREYNNAAFKFREFNSPHEGYAVIKEEFDELWDEIKANDHKKAIKEATQVGAMALRYLIDLSYLAEGGDEKFKVK